MLDRCEFVDVQALVAQPTIEGLDEPVLGRFARTDEVELYPAAIAPLIKCLRGKFRSVIDSYRVRQWVRGRNLFERIHHALSGQRKVRLQSNALAMPFVDDRQHA